MKNLLKAASVGVWRAACIAFGFLFVGYMAATALGSNVLDTQFQPHVPDHRVERITHLADRYDCTTGDHDWIPATAIVSRGEGQPRLVGFDKGWAFQTDGDPDTHLHAVCRRRA